MYEYEPILLYFYNKLQIYFCRSAFHIGGKPSRKLAKDQHAGDAAEKRRNVCQVTRASFREGDSHRPSPTFRMVAVLDTRVFGWLRLPGFPGI